MSGSRPFAHIQNTIFSTLLLSGLQLTPLFVFARQMPPGLYESALFSVFTVCILFFLVKLRIPEGNWQKQLRFELFITLNFGSLLSLLMLLLVIWQTPTEWILLDWEGFSARFGVDAASYFSTPREARANIADFQFSLIEALAQYMLALGGLAFVVVRLSKRIWQQWRYIRARHLIWELTHTHLILIILSILLLAFFLSVYIMNANLSTLPNTNAAIAPTLLVTFVFTYLSAFVFIGLALVVILIPATALSYLISKPITERLQQLAEATAAFRTGAYDRRVVVSGADEVAELQQNFNRMADTLQQALADLQAEHDMMQHLLRSRRELFMSVSHELRTPIATLRGYLESVDRDDKTLPDALRHDFDVMHSETLHLQRLVDDLFAITRASVTQLELKPRPTNIQPLLKRLFDATAMKAWQMKRLEVLAELPPSLPPILVDETRLEQIIYNLLQNAVRHTPPGGIVAIQADTTPSDVVIQIRDTGHGISNEELPLIWKRFYRSDSARQSFTRGVGLGLSLVKELTEAMNGFVTVESRLNEGSCFTVQFPIISAREQNK